MRWRATALLTGVAAIAGVAVLVSFQRSPAKPAALKNRQSYHGASMASQLSFESPPKVVTEDFPKTPNVEDAGRATEPRPTRAEQMDADATRLSLSVRTEPRRANWARATESALLQTLTDKHPEIQIREIFCGSSRCLVEGSAKAKYREIKDALIDAARSTELRNLRLRGVRNEDGSASFRGVIAAGGFDVEGRAVQPPVSSR